MIGMICSPAELCAGLVEPLPVAHIPGQPVGRLAVLGGAERG